MNNLYRIFVLLFATVIFFTSCSEEQNNENQTAIDKTKITVSDTLITQDTLSQKGQKDTVTNSEKNIKAVKNYKYICPLGCEKGHSNIAGICPECGMELIENPDYITKKQNNKK